MIWLILSIISSTVILVLFRVFPRYKVMTFPAIVINYAMAAGFGFMLLSNDYHITEQLDKPWLRGGLAVGLLFITLFYLMAFTAQKIGVGVTSIAVKMSLVIPVAWFMLTDPSDHPTLLKILAVVLAVAGVLLSSKSKGEGFNWSYVLFPVIIFIGSGIIDLVLGYFSNSNYLNSENDQILFSSLPFTTSVTIGIVVLVIQALRGKKVLNLPTLIGGAILGLVNYGSIYFLVRTFDASLLDRSAIIPVNNLGVVLASSLVALIIFSERYTRRNYLGLLLAVVSIMTLISQG